ncbi:sigma factor [Prosthecomicrobium hirschii]|uniref:sigma factor n=1 Tax=Prosthecodimorpha hirschii TaxID=665126 RepID=UPI00128ECFAC|nr:sigma factor [Prosthecomicrobium hirschii]
MTAQQLVPDRRPEDWSAAEVRIALSTARHTAGRHGRRIGLQDADQEDLAQDILLQLIDRSHWYDRGRGAWSTFARIVAVNVVTGHRPARVEEVELGDADAEAPDPKPDLALDLGDFHRMLPDDLARLVELVAQHGSLADARRESGLSTSSFYRAVHEIRLRLRCHGLRPRGKDRRPRR